MTSPGTPHGSEPESSSGYEYPSLENSAPRPDVTPATPPYSPPPAYSPQTPPATGTEWPYPDPQAPAAGYPPLPPQGYPSTPGYPPPYPQTSPDSAYPPAYPAAGGYPPPSGYPPPGGYPGYGYPGYADPYGYGADPSSTNGLAIGSLIASIFGLFTCGAGSLVGIILGVIALGQLKSNPQQGRGLAIAGIVVGGALIGLWVILMLIGALSGPS